MIPAHSPANPRAIALALLAACAVLAAAAPAAAQTFPERPPGLQPPKMPGTAPDDNRSAEELVTVRAAADVDRIRPGQPFMLAVVFDIEPGWHIYWENAGASGSPTTVRVRGPGGYEIGEVHYPRPRAFSDEEGVTYGYEKQTALFIEVTPPIELSAGQVMFMLDVDWLVCKGVCKKGRARLNFSMSTGGSGAPAPLNWKEDPAVKTFKPRLPQPIKDVPEAQANFDGSTLTVRVPARGASAAEFFPANTPGVTYGEAQVAVEDKSLVVTVPITLRPGDALGKPLRVAGIVGVGSAQTEPAYEFEIPVAAASRQQ